MAMVAKNLSHQGKWGDKAVFYEPIRFYVTEISLRFRTKFSVFLQIFLMIFSARHSLLIESPRQRADSAILRRSARPQGPTCTPTAPNLDNALKRSLLTNRVGLQDD
jgi:hypothetical protein